MVKRREVETEYSSRYTARYSVSTSLNLTTNYSQSKFAVETLIGSTGNRRIRGKYRSGGHFSCLKQVMDGGASNVSIVVTRKVGSETVVRSFSGQWTPLVPGSMVFPTPTSTSDNELNGFGTKFYTQTIPTKPVSDAAQFAAELRDLPKLPDLKSFRDKANRFRNLEKKIGSEYLNAEFGWKPFVRDLQKATKATLNAKKHVSQFLRDSGRIVRRRKIMSDTTSTSTTIGSSSYGWPSPPGIWKTAGVLHTTNQSSRKIWGVAAYRYYVPPLDVPWLGNIPRGEAIANKLYGTRVTPSLVWNLAPCSWMADYFGNVGDILSNLSSFNNDNLVCLYGYIMVKSTAIRTYTVFNAVDENNTRHSTSVSLRTVSMTRNVGNPYGFSTSFSPTEKQTAIMAAIAVTR